MTIVISSTGWPTENTLIGNFSIIKKKNSKKGATHDPTVIYIDPWILGPLIVKSSSYVLLTINDGTTRMLIYMDSASWPSECSVTIC